MTAPSRDLVSTVIPAYNCNATLARALDSVLAQDYAAIEVIVVDDNSSEDTHDIVKRYPTVRYFPHPANRGASAARNTGIRNAHGRFIAFLDADDEWFPTKITQQMELIASSPLRPALVTCNSCATGQNSKYTATSDWHSLVRPSRGDRLAPTLLRRNFMPTSTVLVRAEALQCVGLFDERLVVSEDLDLWVRVASRYAIDYLDDVLVRFYDRSGSLMEKGSGGTATQTLRMVERHCDTYKSLISPRERRAILGFRSLSMAYTTCDRRRYRESLKLWAHSLLVGHVSMGTVKLPVKCLLGLAFDAPRGRRASRRPERRP